MTIPKDGDYLEERLIKETYYRNAQPQPQPQQPKDVTIPSLEFISKINSKLFFCPPAIKILSYLADQKVRYIIAGGWNALFGFALFTTAWVLFGKHIHYLILTIIVNEIATINSFISQRYFVFGSSHHGIVVELLRFHLVHLSALLGITIQMWVFVDYCHIHPILAVSGALILTTLCSYFAHKYFTFKSKVGINR
jgi:putative flippase GtrA